jgi:uncharacterized membrane protein YkoI
VRKTSSTKAYLSKWFLAVCFAPATLTFASNPKPQLSMDAAKKIALSKEAGEVKSHELEKEKGRWIYSFDIERDNQVHEVNVDANTGEVVEDSVENPADEAKEKAEEKKQ